MKNLNTYTTIIKFIMIMIFIFSISVSYTQVPDEVNYQMTVRDANDQLVVNQNVGIQISIHQNSANGTVVYKETHHTTTSSYGLANIKIGTGTVQSGTFSSIQWSNYNYFIEIARKTA